MDPVHNARIKKYPDGSAEILIGSQPFGGGNIYRRGMTPDDPRPAFPGPARDIPDGLLEEVEYIRLEHAAKEDEMYEKVRGENADMCRVSSLQRSVRRARKAVQDLARSNEWTYFVTLTLDPEKVDRYDPVEVLRHLRHWLGNNVRRRGLRYVLVPEHHKDGAIHFHGLFNDALEAVDSGTMSVPGRKAPVKVRSEAHREALEARGGCPVYNLPGWGWGFSTAIHLYGEMDAAINYVCKYIGKEMCSTDVRATAAGTPFTGKIGGRWYYSGGDLQRPTVEWFDVDIRDWEGCQGWYSPAALPGVRFLALRVTAGGDVLDPWVAPGRADPKGGSASNSGSHDVGMTGGNCDWRGPSFGLPDEALDALQACPDEKAFDALLWSILYAGKGTPPKIEGYLTKSGLENRGESPGVEGLEAPPGQDGP